MLKLYLNVIRKSESDDYIVMRSRMSSMKWEFWKINKERSRRERHTTRTPSAHQARTGSLVRRNLKYDEDWKNYCQSNVGDVLRIHVNKDIFRSSRLNTFLISSILFFIFSHLNNARFDSSLLHITALAAIGQLHILRYKEPLRVLVRAGISELDVLLGAYLSISQVKLKASPASGLWVIAPQMSIAQSKTTLATRTRLVHRPQPVQLDPVRVAK